MVERHLLRFNLAGLRGEFVIPSGAKEAVIIADGLPATPTKREIMFALADIGFAVFYPQYRGTWQSDGVFLRRSPTTDILELAKYIASRKSIESIYDRRRMPCRFTGIHILGVSFGGSVALECARSRLVKKIIAVAPVTEYRHFGSRKGEQSLEGTIRFIREALGPVYRFDPTGVDALLRGHLLNPATIGRTTYRKKQILILHGGHDPIVPVAAVKRFATRIGATFGLIPEGGHLSLTTPDTEICRWVASYLLTGAPPRVSGTAIVRALLRQFRRRLQTVLAYGSFVEHGRGNDRDLVVVLDRRRPGDPVRLRTALIGFRQLQQQIQLQLLYKTEDVPICPHCYSIHTWGNAFIEVLRRATILYGINPFRDIPVASQDDVQLQLLRKIQQYLYLMRNLFVTAPSFELHQRFFLKKARFIALDYLRARSLISGFPSRRPPHRARAVIAHALRGLRGKQKVSARFLDHLFQLPQTAPPHQPEELAQHCISFAETLYSDLSRRCRGTLTKTKRRG